MTGSGITVHIVDDDPSVLRGLERVMRSANHQVRTYATADEFFSSDIVSECSCLIADAGVPKTGASNLLAAIRDMDLGLPVIVVTADDDPASRRLAQAVGAVGFFRKPVDTEALLDAVEWAVMSYGKSGPEGGQL